MHVYMLYILNWLTWLDNQSILVMKHKYFVVNGAVSRNFTSCDNQLTCNEVLLHHKRARLKIEFDWFDSFVIAVIDRSIHYLVCIIVCIRMRRNEFYIFSEIALPHDFPCHFAFYSWQVYLLTNLFRWFAPACWYSSRFHKQIKINIVKVLHPLSFTA